MVVTCAEISASSAALGGEAVARWASPDAGTLSVSGSSPTRNTISVTRFRAGYTVEFLNECRFEERELV